MGLYTGSMSRSMAGTSYAIGTPSRVCAASGRALETGEAYVAALAQSLETEEFVRLDYAVEAWDGGARPARPLVLMGYWRGKLGVPGARPRMLIDDASLVDLFDQTQEMIEREPSAEREAFRFVLALILIRKRLLVVEKSKGGSMFVRPKGPRVEGGFDESSLVEVTDPGLDAGTIAKVAEQLQGVLSDAFASTAQVSAAAGAKGAGA